MYALEGHLSSMARVITIKSVGHINIEELIVKNIGDNIVGAHYLPTHTIEHLSFQETNNYISKFCLFFHKQTIYLVLQCTF